MKGKKTISQKEDKKKAGENTENSIDHQIDNIHTLNNQEIEKIFTPFKDKEIQEKDFF